MPISLTNPFEARTTLSIDMANRLFALRGQPGFIDLIRLSEETVKVAEDAFVNFDGWDKDELAARSIAFKAARRFHQMLWSRVESVIQGGIEEARQARQEAVDDPFGKDAADMADNLRVAVLERQSDMYDTRVSGTY